MPIREIPGYSPDATGDGCFFLNQHQRKINDPLTGVTRLERVWTTDEYIGENAFDTIIEFSERWASEVAGELGWVPPQINQGLLDQMSDLIKSEQNAVAAKDAAEQAYTTNLRQAVEAIENVGALEIRNAKLESAAKSHAGRLGALQGQLNTANKKLKGLSLGD